MENRFNILLFKNGSVLKSGLMRIILMILVLNFAIGYINVIYALELQQVTVKGAITNQQGTPLVGVTIVVKGSTLGTLSDASGRYSLLNVPKNATLVFSFVGMTTQEIPLEGRMVIDIVLKEVSIGLDEVVVIGYGTSKKRDLTGAVSSVSSKSIEKLVSGNLTQALQGQVSGVNVQQRTGNPGQNASIRIRGANSLTAGVNDPLYVVDGMILSDIGTDFNLTDIQSIDILKDASSTAIYGSRGANGVIIITTKRGLDGKARISYDGYTGLQTPIKKLDVLDASEFKKYYQQSRQNASINTVIDPAIINSTTTTDWQDQIFRTASVQNHTLAIQGGNAQSKYYISTNYFKQEGIIRNSDFSRLSLRYNGDQVLTKKIRINQSITLSNTVRNGASDYEIVVNGAANAIPTLPLLDQTGKPSVVNFPFVRTNPRSLVDLIKNNTRGYRVLGNAQLNYEIVKGLNLVVNAGTEINISNTNSYTPSSLRESSFKGSASKNYGNTWSWINENTLNYSLDIGNNHKINALAGVTFQDNKVDYLNGQSIGYIIDGFQYNNLGAGGTQTVGSSFSEYSLLSYLGRFNYSFKQKLLFTFSGRYDGSSRLAEGGKYKFFPSAALAWRISEENFLKGNKTLSDLKLRGSWGETGSQAVAPYSSFSTMSTTNVYLTGSTSPIIGFVPSTVANPLLTWEMTTQFDAGVDLGLFNNRIQMSADIYKKTTTGLLFKRLVPPTSGFLDVTQNVGEIENKGFEFFIKSNNLIGTLIWNTSFNLSLNRAKTKDLGKNSNGDPITIITSSTLGNWFPILLNEAPYNPYGYTVEGVDKTTGTVTYKDINKDGSIDAKDQGIIGHFEPKFIFGLTNEFSYKNFDLSIFLQGSVGNELFSDAVGNQLLLNGNSNISHYVFDKIGTKYPAQNADYGPTGPFNSSGLYSYEIFNGTYVRVKDITLGYTLPNSLLNKIRLVDLRIYLTATNLFTLDKNYPYYDPEASAGPDIITGWDRGGYMNNKSVLIGIKVDF
jgi:TonB-dependent starch-binding outer membrane protein SusC